MEQPDTIQPPSLDDGQHGKPLIFISHDSRDAEVAEAFSRLLGSVSAGVLKSFRSSDKRGSQGIEYGVEWYPEIMKHLDKASDVVCLLTNNSTNRPWLLYEAGVAKGKLNTPVHGVALGVPLNIAGSGPFAQFQNCDDSRDSLTKLVIQLVRRIPNSEPDRDIILQQVDVFKEKIAPYLGEAAANNGDKAGGDDTSAAKIFEEIKVMFQDLPGRIEHRIDPEHQGHIKRRRKYSPGFIEAFVNTCDNETDDPIAIVTVASLFRDDFPWIYESAVELYRSIESGNPRSEKQFERFLRLFELSTRHPVFRDFAGITHRQEEAFYLIFKMLEKINERNKQNMRRRIIRSHGFSSSRSLRNDPGPEQMKLDAFEEAPCERCGTKTLLRQGSSITCNNCGTTTGTT